MRISSKINTFIESLTENCTPIKTVYRYKYFFIVLISKFFKPKIVFNLNQ